MNVYVYVSYVCNNGRAFSTVKVDNYNPATLYGDIAKIIKEDHVKDGEFTILSINVFPPAYEEESISDRPCDASCIKCGSSDIAIRYHRKGDKWSDLNRQFDVYENEYILKDSIYCTAKVECLTYYCRTCEYDWVSKTMDSSRS